MTDNDRQKVRLHFEFDDEGDAAKAGELIRGRLQELGMVRSVEITNEKARLTGLEVAAAIAVAVTITRNSRELIEEVQKLIPVIRKLVKSFRRAVVEDGPREVAIDESPETTEPA